MDSRPSHDSMETSPGIADRYDIVKALGHGGSGIVYQAHDRVLDRDVAIKTLSVANLDERKLVRFQKEAKALSGLRHEFIIEIIDFGQTKSGKPYMVLEYVDGEALSDYLKGGRSIPLTDVLDLFINICDAMSHAHAHGVLHRDLKPSNIIVTVAEDGRLLPKVIDFGVAALMESETQAAMLTQTGSIIGSPAYMSPEATAGQDIDERTDIYSLGCMLYQVLASELPFKGNTAVETMQMHRVKPVPALPRVSASEDIQGHLQDIIETTMAKEIEDRFASMEQLRNNLADVEEALLTIHEQEEKQRKTDQQIQLIKEKGKSAAWLGISTLSIAIVLACLALYSLSHQSARRQALDKPVSEKKNESSYDVSDERSRQVDQFVESQISMVKPITQKPLEQSLEKLASSSSQIDLSNTILKGIDLSPLARNPVTVLQLMNCGIEPGQLDRLAKSKYLISVDLSHNEDLCNADLTVLRRIATLKRLRLNNIKITDRQLEQIATINQLEELSISANNEEQNGTTVCTFSASGVRALNRLHKLRHLDVNSNRLPVSDLIDSIVSIPTIDSLDITAVDISAEDAKKLSKLQLKRINLNRAAVTPDALETLLASSKLKEIRLISCYHLKDDKISYLKGKYPDCRFVLDPQMRDKPLDSEVLDQVM